MRGGLKIAVTLISALVLSAKNQGKSVNVNLNRCIDKSCLPVSGVTWASTAALVVKGEESFFAAK